MAGRTTPELSPEHVESNEEMQEMIFANRGCCFCFPCFQSGRPDTVWERISTAEKEETSWWSKSVNALKKVREWSEIFAGPKWKTFIRRFGRNKGKQVKFQYDPLSYALNFDEGPGQNGHGDDDFIYRDFSSRFASIPASSKSSMDLGRDGPSFT